MLSCPNDESPANVEAAVCVALFLWYIRWFCYQYHLSCTSYGVGYWSSVLIYRITMLKTLLLFWKLVLYWYWGSPTVPYNLHRWQCLHRHYTPPTLSGKNSYNSTFSLLKVFAQNMLLSMCQSGLAERFWSEWFTGDSYIWLVLVTFILFKLWVSWHVSKFC